MKPKLTTLFLLWVIATAFIPPTDKDKIVSLAEFREFISPIGLKYEMPQGFKESSVKENPDLFYNFAIKDKKADFEVRYSIWSLEPAIEEFKKCKLDTNCLMVSPNVIYKGRIQANVLNMTGGQQWPIDPFPGNAVKKEFNADLGGSSFFEFNCAFGKGYKYGQMIYLHKDDVADVIISYMGNDKSTFSGNMERAFHSLQFR